MLVYIEGKHVSFICNCTSLMLEYTNMYRNDDDNDDCGALLLLHVDLLVYNTCIGISCKLYACNVDKCYE